MATTSVHFPKGLLEQLDRLAAERGVSRNRLIVESCQRTARSRSQWPDRFFANDHLTAEELAELREHANGFARAISAARRSRKKPPL